MTSAIITETRVPAETGTAEYLVAQYIPVLLRNEPRNVGVIVRRGHERTALFLGEPEPGATIDGRRLRSHEHPTIYRQWVAYWRRVLISPSASWNSLSDLDRGNYRVRVGGTVERTDGDSLRAVAQYLYHIVVGDGLLEAYQRTPEIETTAKLAEEVDAALETEGLLARDTPDDVPIPHPVRRKVQVQGSAQVPHVPQFSQENGALWIMETVDFTSTQKQLARDHAAYAAYMFGDIRSGMPSVQVAPIAVVRMTLADENQDAVRQGLNALRQADASVVNWLDDLARETFTADRRRIAFNL